MASTPDRDASEDMSQTTGKTNITSLRQSGASGRDALLSENLREALNAIPAHIWYASPSGGLTFTNRRDADYGGLEQDHPLRFGIDTGAPWDAHIPLLHPDDHDETRRVWANCLKTETAGEVSFRVRNAQGGYRWFVSRAEPLRASDGTLLCWVGINFDVEERVQAEFYLKEGQRLAHIGSWAFDATGFTHWSAQLFEIYGLPPGSKPPSISEYINLVHPDDRDFVGNAIQKMQSDHTVFDFTKRIVRPDGVVRHVRCVGIPTADTGFLGTGIDVTEHEELTRAIRKSEEELRQILDFTPQMVAVLGPNRERLFANRGALDYLGVTLEEYIEERAAAAGRHEIYPEDMERLETMWQAAMMSGQSFELEKRMRKSDGSYRWFLARYTAVRDDEGRVQRWYIASTDIEDRKRQEEMLRQILDLTPQIIGVVSHRRERLYANRTALDYFGITLEEWRKLKPGSDVHPDDSDQLQSKWVRALSGGVGFENEQRIRAKDGSYRWFLVRYNPVRGSDGTVARWHIASTDIEGQKRREENLQRENAALRAEISQSSMFDEIVGSSDSLRKVLTEVDKVARTDATILIRGETGTGKELIARAIHRRSPRAARPFVAVNCGAIPASLVASELFGHEKGAFTGATQRHLGRFEAANGGTIFLDEVGDLPPDVQIALLRVLQEREIERVGGDKPIPIDVRILAATHRDLEKLVREGKFREDLFYRLDVVPLTMPPLRERAADIPVLVEYFIAKFGKKAGKTFDRIEKSTMEVMQSYRWPGNVRELQNVIERAVTLSDSKKFAVDEAWLKRQPPQSELTGAPLNGALLAHEKDVIEAALAECHGRMSGPTGAAVKLGIPTSTLDSKIKRLGIDKYRFKSQ
jgi:formate hydrogenlyase transcriptional activator